MALFVYGETELEHLRKRDRRLGQAIDEIGPIEREVIPDPFAALVHTVVGQQISSRAAAAIWSRLRQQYWRLAPSSACAGAAERCAAKNAPPAGERRRRHCAAPAHLTT